MTIEERFERIEHITAGLVEERRKDREEHGQLWRETQRQITETNAAVAALAFKIHDTNNAVSRLADEARAETLRAQAAEKELRDRVSNLVSAIGQLISRTPATADPDQLR